MKRTIQQELRKKKGQLSRRLDRARKRRDTGQPVFSGSTPRYEIGKRVRAMPHGGIGAVHQIALTTGLVERIDEYVKVLKLHRPYHESDHVLNIAYNMICGGETLDDIELRRNDEVFLDALDVEAIPDPTTAGDFCRRFAESDIQQLMAAINETRVEIWKKQGSEFTAQRARIDADGTLVATTGECKGGMALSHNGVWGYHPLVVSLANTREPLFVVNRSGNRPSHEGAACYLDKAIGLCRQAGFSDILLRGDTDFSQTRHLDRWNDDGVKFVFGYDAAPNLTQRADSLGQSDYVELERRAKRAFVDKEKRRARQPRVKEQVVREKGYKNIRLRSEDIAEFEYSPTACNATYRMVVLRKNLTVERGERALFDDIRYFFYITNDRDMSGADVIFEANDRCDQENLIAQLKGGVRALHAPVNTFNANWAYMLMASLAWTLKAWMALSIPVTPRWRNKHMRERRRWLRMEFRTFQNSVINFPVQVVRTGRQLIHRVIAWRPELPVLFRLLHAL